MRTFIKPWMAEMIADEVNVKRVETPERVYYFDTIKRKLTGWVDKPAPEEQSDE